MDRVLTTVPTIDIHELDSLERPTGEVAEKLEYAFRQYGFFSLVGHGVSTSVIDDAFAASRKFFDQPAQEKMLSTPSDGFLGYRGLGTLRASTRNAQSSTDMKETFSLGPDSSHGLPSSASVASTNIWPAGVPELRPALVTYYESMASLALKLTDIISVALGLPADSLRNRSDRQLSWLASINYPPTVDARPDQMRFGEHRDRNCVTILSATGDGLEVQDISGQWHQVPTRPYTFLVNAGRMLADWVGGRWTAAQHRVCNPAGAARRQSLVYFFNPNPETPLDPLCGKSDGQRPESSRTVITVGDYLKSMLDLYR
ncbi:isopenicillin N synthase family dioxygenase [Micromonospora sp. NPDC048830]|uniref:isopenicillin N synthase family dioxygenase n=1 Tax=Micromonospora sp. NPDC048830 TaxID=3364257 RepID=UPI00371A975B